MNRKRNVMRNKANDYVNSNCNVTHLPVASLEITTDKHSTLKVSFRLRQNVHNRNALGVLVGLLSAPLPRERERERERERGGEREGGDRERERERERGGERGGR